MDTKAAEFAQRLGARIVQLRKEHNFAQERLATLARMNKGYLSSVESGQRVPSVGMLTKLAKVLQVQVFDLFVFPDGGPLDRLWEEIRVGVSPAAEQLRAQFGVGGSGTRSKGTTRTSRAPIARPRKSTVKTPTRLAAKTKGRGTTTKPGARKATTRSPAKSAKRRPR